MIQVSTIKISIMIEEGRINPKYLHFLSEREALNNKAKQKIKLLGNQEYFPVLSDGIHSAVNLNSKGKIRYLYVHSLKDGFIDENDKIYLDEEDHASNLKKELKDNDVLLSVVGTLGNTAMISSYVKKPCSLPRNIAFIRCNQNLILPEYLTCFFLSDFAKNQSNFSGGGNIQGLLSLTKLKKFLILVPSILEQVTIANLYKEALRLQFESLKIISDSVKELEEILGISEKINSKKNYFPVKSSDLITESRWTPNLYNPLVDIASDNISKKYEIKKLSQIANFFKGDEIGSDSYQNYSDKSQDAFPFVRTSDIFNYEIDSHPDFWASKDIFNDLAQKFSDGDLIVNNDGKIGFPAMLTKEDKAIFQSHIRGIRSKDPDFSNEYLFLCLLTSVFGEEQFKKFTVIQTTIPTLGNRLGRFKIPVIHKLDRDRLTQKICEAYKLIENKKLIIKKVRLAINKIISEAEFSNN